MAAKKPLTRVLVAKDELEKMTKEDLQKCWLRQDQYIEYIETKLNTNSEHSELVTLRESEEKLKQQQLESTRRENILVMRLTTKEQEMQEYGGQVQELKQAQIPSVAQLRSAFLDPAVNLLFEKMRQEMESLKARLEETQNELSAWKFTPDSNTGKRLMAKCRLLYQENEELGKVTSSGKMAKLEGDLALQKSFSEEMKKSQSELDEFLLELDEDVEGMQSTICYLQQQLREAKDQITQLQTKETPSILQNGSPVNHRLISSEDSMDTERDASVTQQLIDKKPYCLSPPLSNDLNQTSLENEDDLLHRPPSPHLLYPIKTEMQTEFVMAPIKTEPLESMVIYEQPVSFQSVIVENITKVCDVQLSAASRTDVLIDGLGNEQAIDMSRTKNDRDDKRLSGVEEVVSTPKTPKRTSGRKRARPRTPVDTIKEENLPTKKRLRRRGVETLVENSNEEKRTPLEIDTDTEVQVAQTLASWASAKQERKELRVDMQDNLGSTVGNGELKFKKN